MGELILLDADEFYAKLEELLQKHQHRIEPEVFKWISGEEAMNLLKISSPTTLNRLRQTGSIRYTYVSSRKVLLYDRHSIEKYLESNAQETF